jgi:pSer/pThr/pTyr-binding forkhead associated (FHA) protein
VSVPAPAAVSPAGGSVSPPGGFASSFASAPAAAPPASGGNFSPALRASPSPAPSSCPKCGNGVTPGLPFCGYCGTRVGTRVSVDISALPAAPTPGGTAVFGAGRLVQGPKLALLDENGEPAKTYTLDQGEAVIGRGDADIKFADDHLMSPLHARLETRDGQLHIRDLGSRNGTWVFIDGPTKLADGELLLIGSQILRFRRLGYPGPHQAEADSTRRLGSSVPTVDIAVLEQLRADGSVRDVFHLSPGRNIAVGRETGDWIFPYDATMSGRHAELRAEDSDFYVHDAQSRNGVALSVRGGGSERPLKRGQRILLGDQIFRVESV